MRSTLLERIEEYYDAVPRSGGRAEQHGPLTLFVSRGAGWPYYARPRRGWPHPVTAAHVRTMRARQRRLGVPEAFEWVDDVTPAMAAAARETGLHVNEHPLLVLTAERWRPVAAPAGVSIDILDPTAPDLAEVRAVANLAFGEPGTAIGRGDRRELAAAAELVGDAGVARLRARLREGLTIMAAARDAEGPLSVGSHQPVGPVTEISGVGTLPAARRRGLAAAVTSALVGDALERGTEVVFLTAADDEVARLYGRLGFERLATAMIAEPPPAL